eukprot:953069_1
MDPDERNESYSPSSSILAPTASFPMLPSAGPMRVRSPVRLSTTRTRAHTVVAETASPRTSTRMIASGARFRRELEEAREREVRLTRRLETNEEKLSRYTKEVKQLRALTATQTKDIDYLQKNQIYTNETSGGSLSRYAFRGRAHRKHWKGPRVRGGVWNLRC